MNFDKNNLNGDINSLFDCRGNEISLTEEKGAFDGYPLAMVYAVNQHFRNINDPATGLARGTIFAELDLPFLASEGGKRC